MNQVTRAAQATGYAVDPGHVAAMFDTVAKKAEKIAIVQGSESWTYARFGAEVRRISRGFLMQGVSPGDRIVLHLGNCIQAAIACWAGMSIGAIVVPMNTNMKPAEVERILQRLRPSLYLGHANLQYTMADIDPTVLPADRRFVVDGPIEASASRNWEDLLAGEDPGSTSPYEGVDAPAMLLMTSGTTGDPKLVVRTQRTLAHQVALTGSFALDADSIVLCATPLFHSPGTVAIVTCMAMGTTVVLPACREFEAGAFLDAIEMHGCTWLLCSPFGIAELISAQRAQPRIVDSLEHCLVAGDVAPQNLYSDFKTAFPVGLHNFLGMTEASGQLTFGSMPESLRAVSGLACLLGEDGKPTPKGKLGELAIRGGHVSPGYWTGPGTIDDPKVDGWFRTGDMMREEEDGEFRYVGRKKNVIVRDGENISPIEIEQVLLRHPEVVDAAVAGVPDALLGQRVVAFIALAHPSKECDTTEILHTVALQLSHYKVPESLTVVERIPRNSFRKMDRRAVAAMAAQQSGGNKED